MRPFSRTFLASLLLSASVAVTACGPDSRASQSTPSTSGPATSTPAAASDADPVRAASIGAIPNVHVAGDIYFAGQPSPADFAALKAAGVTEVINLRLPAEMAGFDESAAASASGMNYASVPWNGPAMLTDDVFAKTRDLLKAAEGKTLLHCHSGNRVGAVWIPFRVLDQGVDIEQAVQEARAIGMRVPEYETIARDYVARNR